MHNNLILIGFMGVGKGRTARQLASLSGRFAIDSDDLIESLTKKKIRKIFSEQGEAKFRQLEQHTANWLEESVRNTVVSTGGGFFMVDNIEKIGEVIYLHSSVEEIIASIQNHPNGSKKIKKRPLLQNFEQAKKLYEQRLPLYRATAKYEVNVEQKDIVEVAAEILKLTQSTI